MQSQPHVPCLAQGRGPGLRGTGIPLRPLTLHSPLQLLPNVTERDAETRAQGGAMGTEKQSESLPGGLCPACPDSAGSRGTLSLSRGLSAVMVVVRTQLLAGGTVENVLSGWPSKPWS